MASKQNSGEKCTSFLIACTYRPHSPDPLLETISHAKDPLPMCATCNVGLSNGHTSVGFPICTMGREHPCANTETHC